MMYLIIIIVVMVAWLVLAYNGLIRTRTQAEEAYSDIDVQLKRRYDPPVTPPTVNRTKIAGIQE
jgi:LemA protein